MVWRFDEAMGENDVLVPAAALNMDVTSRTTFPMNLSVKALLFLHLFWRVKVFKFRFFYFPSLWRVESKASCTEEIKLWTLQWWNCWQCVCWGWEALAQLPGVTRLVFIDDIIMKSRTCTRSDVPDPQIGSVMDSRGSRILILNIISFNAYKGTNENKQNKQIVDELKVVIMTVTETERFLDQDVVKKFRETEDHKLELLFKDWRCFDLILNRDQSLLDRFDIIHTNKNTNMCLLFLHFYSSLSILSI